MVNDIRNYLSSYNCPNEKEKLGCGASGDSDDLHKLLKDEKRDLDTLNKRIDMDTNRILKLGRSIEILLLDFNHYGVGNGVAGTDDHV